MPQALLPWQICLQLQSQASSGPFWWVVKLQSASKLQAVLATKRKHERTSQDQTESLNLRYTEVYIGVYACQSAPFACGGLFL